MSVLNNMPSDSHSFVIRIWNDASDADGATNAAASSWRGSIDNVGTGKRVHFSDLEAMVRFIQESSGLQIQPPPSSPGDLTQRLA